MKEEKGRWERRWGPQGTGVRGSGWVGLLQGGGTDDRGKGRHPAQASGPSQTLALLLRAP